MEQLPGWKLAFIMTCNKEKIENLETNKYYRKKKKKTIKSYNHISIRVGAFSDPQKPQLNFHKEIHNP